MAIKHFSVNLSIILLFFSSVALSTSDIAQLINEKNENNGLQSDENSCVYTVYVRTSKTFSAGTDSIISLALYGDNGDGVLIKDLEAWGGIMGEGYDYYERGNLDIFTGSGPCLDRPVCSMKLMSDGSGEHHGWYCNYVEVTTTGPHLGCAQQLFTVEQWLALDRSPHELTAVRNNCEDDDDRLGNRRTKFGRGDVLRQSS
ncbi:PLAT domain-containing protein 3-like isoform X2 [Silene latifolia]|uniref:PLAT domain-containing protein 3-like isoform X2 n=1 Tax=Silene latifolia TaxID=37657 RepID=UPI003D777D90